MNKVKAPAVSAGAFLVRFSGANELGGNFFFAQMPFQATECTVLDLANSFSRDRKLAPHLFERCWLVGLETVVEAYDFGFAFGQLVEPFLQGLLDVSVVDVLVG